MKKLTNTCENVRMHNNSGESYPTYIEKGQKLCDLCLLYKFKLDSYEDDWGISRIDADDVIKVLREVTKL